MYGWAPRRICPRLSPDLEPVAHEDVNFVAVRLDDVHDVSAATRARRHALDVAGILARPPRRLVQRRQIGPPNPGGTAPWGGCVCGVCASGTGGVRVRLLPSPPAHHDDERAKAQRGQASAGGCADARCRRGLVFVGSHDRVALVRRIAASRPAEPPGALPRQDVPPVMSRPSRGAARRAASYSAASAHEHSSPVSAMREEAIPAGDRISAWCCPDAAHDRQGQGRRAIRQRDRKFVTAEPPEHVAAAQRRGPSARDGAKQVVASRMPVRVVEGLEAVEVQHGNRELGSLPAGTRELAR